VDDIINYLKISYPENESILIGCRIGSCNYYECCEYDIIVLDSKNENFIGNKNYKYNLFQLYDKKLKIMLYNKEKFIQNTGLNFQDYINLTNSFFKSNMKDYFKEKKDYSQKNFRILTKRKLIQFALDCTSISKQILNDTLNQNLSSFYLKMLSFNALEVLIQLFLNCHPSPSHLKYQMNAIRYKNPKIKYHVDLVSEYLQLERSNISTINRSEKSIMFLLEHNNCHHLEIESFKAKLNFFRTKSMYVDANLLIHSFIKRQNFSKNYINSYNRLLNFILDIQNKEKITLLKELDLLFNTIKNFIKNSY
jgi:hypothetical protein